MHNGHIFEECFSVKRKKTSRKVNSHVSISCIKYIPAILYNRNVTIKHIQIISFGFSPTCTYGSGKESDFDIIVQDRAVLEIGNHTMRICVFGHL